MHTLNTKAVKMNRIGTVACFLGLLGLVGVGGAVTDLPPDATFTAWFQLLGAAALSAMVAQMGVSMLKEDS
jgi:predicted phage tail protein